MNLWLPPLALVVGAAITGVAAYAVAKRQRSGRIETSEATDLWAAVRNMLKESRDEVVGLRADAVMLRAELRDLKLEIAALRAQLKGGGGSG